MLLWIVLLFIVALFLVLLIPSLWASKIYERYAGSREVRCPETHRQVAVSFKAFRAAITGFYKKSPDLRLAKCTLWPRGVYCDQECIPDAVEAESCTKGEITPSKSKKIYHLPVLMAAFVSWVFGAFWHAQYLFRPQWMNAVGLSRTELRHFVKSLSPHLVTAAVCLLFAYGVAWLLMWSRRKNIWRGIAAALSLWFAIGFSSLLVTGFTDITRDLLRLEIEYTLIASLVVGAIIGGVNNKLSLREFWGQRIDKKFATTRI